ncbi:hypothetical protein V496_06128 [Pseudogymnoascus sp. VKM F-4515 (FW-2607)]|nr:hypothetical protein V496_06128 [Pseudogymnoascus sp. VKM F-4515 (FW-2607)]KFY80041.1 hypothetical protein V498_08856 [Pseudogymnoascus sp. VKM F-4517 (FW-2822)]
MLPPSAHWKGFLRFGLIRFRSISSHGTDYTTSHRIAQNAPLRSQIPISSGYIRRKRARRQYIAQRRSPFPGLAIFRGRRHALGRTVNRPGGSICYRATVLRPSLRSRIPHRRVGEHDVPPTTNINNPSTLNQHPQSEAREDYCPQLAISRALDSPVLTHAVSNRFDAEDIVKESSSGSFGSRNGLGHHYRARTLSTDGAIAVPSPARTSSCHVRRKQLTRKLGRKGLGSKRLVNAQGYIRTSRQSWPRQGHFRPVRLAVTSTGQRRSIRFISRPLGKKIEVLRWPLRAGSNEEHTGLPTGIDRSRSGNVPAEVPTRLTSCTTAAELPATYTDTKDPTFSETSSEIHRQDILTKEILTWFRNPEVRNGNNANSLQPCIYKSPATQLTVVDQASPTILQHTEREEATSTGPPSEVLGAPFLLPSLKEPSTYSNGTDRPIAGLSVAHMFEHPPLPESGMKMGDPVKRNIIFNHRPSNPSASSPTTPPSLLSFQKAIPDLAPPTALPVLDGPEVTYQDILDGLQLGLSAILGSSDVDFWVKEVVGTSARHFLADIAALGGLRGE